MPKQLNVNLAFTADTQQVKGQLQELQQYLSKLTTNANKSPLGITEEISEAVNKTTQLQVALEKATSKTGKLDLGQFRQELNKANLSAEQIAASLSALGPEGQAAFAKLAQSVSLAEVPIKRTNRLLQEFATTLRNTAKWQISSSILHGFMGSVQSAYRYAQDLNESLNNIRIVTGQSTEQMAQFAKEANEAAKSLSTTTTAYTDAALIFYQQGLDDEAVKARTDVTIKMANVTGDAAEDVSSYMTAIWNNFDDGSESLEHYADVITALGAATAASSAEIAAGLEKFASIGKTVGLSYDYATAALATVVAATRQSEDVVGTAFKTIFSRIQGLSLGETLEDDVDLNKYSKAMQAVGVSVLDATGELRDLDDILDDLAVKWDTLTSAQQTALAQTVAGTRQYAQFIALMSNWDFMEQNLEVARGSEGTLQEQADIYAESWKAASKEVKASMQAIYQDLLNDEFFIKLTKGASEVANAIHKVIESIGGLKGVIPIVSSLLLQMFGKDLSNSINNFIYNIQLMTKKGKQALYDTRKAFNDELIRIKTDSQELPGVGEAYSQRGEAQNLLIEKTIKLQSLNKEITEEEQNQLNLLFDINESYINQYQESLKILDNLEKENDTLIKKASYQVRDLGGIASPNDENILLKDNEVSKILKDLGELQVKWSEVSQLKKEFYQVSENGAGDVVAQKQLKDLHKILDELKPSLKEDAEYIQDLDAALELLENAKGPEEVNKAFALLDDTLSILGEDTLQDLINGIDQTKKGSSALITTLTTLKEKWNITGQQIVEVVKKQDACNKSIEATNKNIKNLKGTITTIPQAFIGLGQGLSSFAMYLNSIKSLVDSFSNPDLSGIERATTILMGFGMLISGISSTIKGFSTVFNGITDAYTAFLAKQKAKIALDQAEIISNKAKIASMQSEIAWSKISSVADEEQGRKIASLITKEQLEAVAKGELTKKEAILNVAKEAGIKIDGRSVAENSKLTSAIWTQAEANIANTEAIEAETQGLVKLKAANESSKASFASNPYLLIIAAAITALVAGITIYNKAQQRRAENDDELANKALEAEKKRISGIEEHINKLEELENKYKDLASQYDNQEISLEDLQTKTYLLCKQYGLQDEALQALISDYKQIDEIAAQAKIEANNEIINEADNYEEVLKRKLISQQKLGNINRNLGDWLYSEVDKNEGLLEFNTGATTSKDEYAFFDSLMEIIGSDLRLADYQKEDSLGSFDGVTGTITFENYGDTIAKNWDKIEALFDDYSQLANNNIYKTFKKYFDEIADTVTDYQEYLKKKEDAELANIGFENYQGNIDSYEKYLDIRRTMAEQAIEKEYFEESEIGQKAAENWADNFLSQYDEVLEYITEHGYIEAAQKQLGFSTQQGVEKYVDILKEYQDANNANQILKGSLQDYDINKGFSEENIAAFFKDKNITSQLGFSEDSFNTADQADQLILIANTWIKNTKAVEEYKKEVKEVLEEQEKALSSQLLNRGEQFDRANEELEELINSSEKYKNSQDEIKQIILKLANAEDSLSDKEREKLNEFKEENNISEDRLISLGKEYNEYKNLENAYDNIINQINSYDNELSTSKDRLAAYDNLQAVLNATLDNVQSAYQSLNSIVDDYNKSGSWTIDNVQKLIEMDDEYVATLQFEGDQLSINEEYYQQLTLTKLEEMKQTVLLQMEEKLEALTKRDLVDASNKAAAAEIFHQQSVTQGIEVAKEGAKAWKEYADSLIAGLGITDAESLAEAKKITDASYNRLQAIDSTIGSVKKGGSSMRAAMGGGSGGSSGGGSKQKETKDQKDFNDEFDRFYPIKKAIEDLTDALNDLSKVQEHVFGATLVKALKEENKLLGQQKDKYKDLLNAQLDYQKELAGGLAYYGANIDTSTGNITNYDALTQGMLQNYNNAVTAYNNSAQSDADKAAFENASKQYENFKDLLSKYQGILTDIQDTQNNLDDIYYKQIENNLKQFEVDIQLNLDIAEAERKVNDFIKDINKNFKTVYRSSQEWIDGFVTALANAESFTEDIVGTIPTDLAALDKVAEIIDNPNYNYRSDESMFADRSEAIMKYKELTEQLMSDSKELYDLYKNSWDDYLEAISEVTDKWSDITDNIDRVADTLEHYIKVNELIYGGSETSLGRSNLNQLYSSAAANSLTKQNVLAEEIKALEKEYAELVAEGAQEGEKDLKAVKDAINNANKELESEIESYIDTIQAQLQNAVAIAKYAMDSDVWGGDFEQTKERWQDAQRQAEGYYDSVERIYQLESLRNKWQDSINSTSSVKMQQQLTELMERQLGNLEEKTALSQTDVELAEKELEVYKAQIALEEAQNNKNTMKLVRNEQGNWAYQYVADPDEVKGKEQDYLDKVNEWRIASINATNEIEENVMEAYEDFSTRMSEIMSNVTLSEEERADRIQYLNELYWGVDGIITKAVEDSNLTQRMANEATFIELGSLYIQDADNYELMSDREKDLIESFKDFSIDSYQQLRNVVAGEGGIYDELLEKAVQTNNDTVWSWNQMAANAIKRMYTDSDSVRNIIEKAYNDMIIALQRYDNAVAISEVKSEVAWTNVENALRKVEVQLDEIINDTDRLSTYRGTIEQIGQAWLNVRASIESATQSLNQYMNALRQANALAASQLSYGVGGYSGLGTTGAGAGSTGTGGGSPTGGGDGRKDGYWSALDNSTNTWHYDVASTLPGVTAWVEAVGGMVTTTNSGGKHPYVTYVPKTNRTTSQNKGGGSGNIHLFGQDRNVSTFASGGYTGDWSNTVGRLAVLHEKELVLNQDDTKNLLTTVNAVRDLTFAGGSIGDNLSSTITRGIADMVGSLLGIKPAEVGDITNNNTKNSEFHITANFPNANSMTEIREAILSLPTLASQYLSQK